MAKGYKTPGSGRKPGSENKTSKLAKDFLVSLIEKYSAIDESGRSDALDDFLALTPYDRIRVAVVAAKKLIPNETNVHADVDGAKVSAEERLTSILGEECGE